MNTDLNISYVVADAAVPVPVAQLFLLSCCATLAPYVLAALQQRDVKFMARVRVLVGVHFQQQDTRTCGVVRWWVRPTVHARGAAAWLPGGVVCGQPLCARRTPVVLLILTSPTVTCVHMSLCALHTPFFDVAKVLHRIAPPACRWIYI